MRVDALEFSDLVALKKKLPNTSFVPLFTSNCYMNSNRDLRVYRVGTHLLMTNPLRIIFFIIHKIFSLARAIGLNASRFPNFLKPMDNKHNRVFRFSGFKKEIA